MVLLITHKFRLYPSEGQEEKLLFILERCRWLYNKLLSIINENKKTLSKREIQSMLPKLKEERTELKEVNAKTLQMVVFMLYNNLKALSALKKRGKKVGKLRYKKYGKFKSFILNQSGFKLIETGSRLDVIHLKGRRSSHKDASFY